MKTNYFLAVLSTILISAAALADRTDVWLASSVKVQSVILSKLPDGGCSVEAAGYYVKSDGGRSDVEVTANTEVAGANRTDCLQILDTRAPVLFKADKGL